MDAVDRSSPAAVFAISSPIGKNVIRSGGQVKGRVREHCGGVLPADYRRSSLDDLRLLDPALRLPGPVVCASALTRRADCDILVKIRSSTLDYVETTPMQSSACPGVEDKEPMTQKISKNLTKARALVEPRPYTLTDAVPLLQKAKYAKFDETVDLTLRLGVDPKHADQMVRGTVVLPHGLGKSKTVAVIASGDKVRDAEAAGAEFFGGEELVEKIQKEGWTDFDALIATPDMMKSVGRLGKVLGPRGLMPNPKTGTVTTDVAAAIREIKAGKVEFRTDKTALVHVPVGKLSFDPQKLVDNAMTVISSVMKAKPSAAKGKYIKGITLSSTMGPGIQLDAAAAELAGKA